MNTKEYFLNEVADLVSIVRFHRQDEDRKGTLLELKATLNAWLLDTGTPMHVMQLRYEKDSQAVVLEVKALCDSDDSDEYLGALQDLLSLTVLNIEVEEWEPKLYGHDFEFAVVDELPMGLKHRAIKSSAPTTADSLHAALALAVHGYGPPKKGSKGKPARW